MTSPVTTSTCNIRLSNTLRNLLDMTGLEVLYEDPDPDTSTNTSPSTATTPNLYRS